MTPDVFDYLDHHSFLNDWLSFLKISKKRSFRQLATASGISVGSLSLCLSGERKWTLKLLGKVMPHLELKKEEQEALRLLFEISTTEQTEQRISAFDRLRRLPSYSKKHRDSSTVYLYLKSWINVAIREMVHLKDFKLDTKWIHKKLHYLPKESEIEKATKFLVKEGYIKKDKNNQWYTPSPQLECHEGVFRLSMGEYHRQILKIGERSIEEVPRDLRLILGHTSAMNGEQKLKAESILKKALTDIQNLNKEQGEVDQIYQFELLMIPLSRKGEAA